MTALGSVELSQIIMPRKPTYILEFFYEPDDSTQTRQHNIDTFFHENVIPQGSSLTLFLQNHGFMFSSNKSHVICFRKK